MGNISAGLCGCGIRVKITSVKESFRHDVSKTWNKTVGKKLNKYMSCYLYRHIARCNLNSNSLKTNLMKNIQAQYL
jgi:hypothetical protein